MNRHVDSPKGDDRPMDRIRAADGLLLFLVRRIRPELADAIARTDRLETVVVGLGSQGLKHAGLMHEYGTSVVGGIAPDYRGSLVHETIPVYPSVRDCLAEHPHVVAASIWRHHSTAAEAAVETIESGIPVVVLISEGIPLQDMRDVIAAARAHRTMLFGGNTPGLIFPPERIKIGMLPDVFHPEEPSPGRIGPCGVTILSRSGAILYHMSDALASVGIAQNAVIGIGGDGAVGSVFRDLVPLVMGHRHTDLVVVAGEVGGCQEELLAEDFKTHPERFPKPLVALISGALTPEGKRMGHAGAVVTPGLQTGTFKSKKAALESAGIPVVNSQYDLIRVVAEKLGGRTYFDPKQYYEKMSKIWNAPPPELRWTTRITDARPNRLSIRGYRLETLIEKASFLETVHCLVTGELPDLSAVRAHTRLAINAAQKPVPRVYRNPSEDVSKTFQKYILADERLAGFEAGKVPDQASKIVFAVGRMLAYTARILGHEALVPTADPAKPFSHILYRVLSGKRTVDPSKARLLEAMAVACTDHGVTPPSAQATLIASSVRASYESAVAQGIGAITDVHGGAGQKACLFFLEAGRMVRKGRMDPAEAMRELIARSMREGERIEGLGHRVHTEDPRRDVLWGMAESAGVSGICTRLSRIIGRVFEEVRGISLPINVDGVIGALVADLGFDPMAAKILFIFGRMAGLSAHHFEEIATQPPMRRIDFEKADYRGPGDRPYPDRTSGE